jgi:hypothetical protein
VGLRREVLAPNQIRLDGVTLGSQIIRQTAEAEEVLCAGGIV